MVIRGEGRAQVGVGDWVRVQDARCKTQDSRRRVDCGGVRRVERVGNAEMTGARPAMLEREKRETTKGDGGRTQFETAQREVGAVVGTSRKEQESAKGLVMSLG